MFDDTGTTGGWPAANGQSTRRSFLGGLGATVGLGALTGSGRAQPTGASSPDGTVYYVARIGDLELPGRKRGWNRSENGNGNHNGANNGEHARGRLTDAEYLVLEGQTGTIAFTTDGTAEEAFQYAFDELSGSGGTVVASGDTFEFGGPATAGDGTALVGSGGTRFVVAGASGESGHDLLRVRGDGATVANVEFDANGTQTDNHAIQADDCDGLVIANNRTVDGFQMAISFSRCRNVRVVGNEVLDPNWYGITARAADDERDLRRSENVLVAQNYVAGVTYNNIATYNVSNFAVSGNVVEDGGHSLIACSPAQQGAIVGNVCRDLEEYAPDPGGEAGIEIEYKETHVREEIAGTDRARSYDITISGNQVDNCPVGILARTVPADPEDESTRETERPHSFTVTGNSINGAGAAGIRIRSGAAGVVATNTVRDSATPLEVDETYAVDIQEGLNATRA
ncbi:parallel beta helix pectate lyase-like protein [Halopiger aswanensis]|uniref:Parallel beta helix pectate lyase-like protein n=2 Tax=Halopiger aswanensis TaxID=148449 RepID=A0A3R7E0K5_9EURY|nr:right-handed parallel beta-helix repeat-containing protein [Halopiger aswanensis]RKD97115.1 parallel beta helix pectate lyase-like protein [Halopiger aswanensis]